MPSFTVWGRTRREVGVVYCEICVLRSLAVRRMVTKKATDGPLEVSLMSVMYTVYLTPRSSPTAPKSHTPTRTLPRLGLAKIGQERLNLLTQQHLHFFTNSGSYSSSDRSTSSLRQTPVCPPSPGAAACSQQKKSLEGHLGLWACSWWKTKPPVRPSLVVQIRFVF